MKLYLSLLIISLGIQGCAQVHYTSIINPTTGEHKETVLYNRVFNQQISDFQWTKPDGTVVKIQQNANNDYLYGIIGQLLNNLGSQAISSGKKAAIAGGV